MRRPTNNAPPSAAANGPVRRTDYSDAFAHAAIAVAELWVGASARIFPAEIIAD